MIIPEKLKLNQFKLVKIPTNKEYFGRVGLTSAGTPAQYSGDEFARPEQSKVDQILEADREYAKYLQSESAKSDE